MRHANKYESADDDVEHRVSRNEYQDASCVGGQPYVVLANEELEGERLKLDTNRGSTITSHFLPNLNIS